MMRLFATLAILFLATSKVFAWGKDSVGPPESRFSISLQVGLPNTIQGAEVGPDDRYFYTEGGDYRAISLSSGTTFRWYYDESFFFQLRGTYSVNNECVYDSVAHPTAYYSSSVVNEQYTWTSVTDNFYKSSNLLIGIGGGHELRVKKFLVRAGGEIDFMKYLTQQYYFEGRGDHHSYYDSITNAGTYDYHAEYVSINNFYTPRFWGLGIVGHASLEYKLNKRFGIGATIMTGVIYSAALKGELVHEFKGVDHVYDSNGQDQTMIEETREVHTSNQQQIKMMPLNAQMNFVFYFGRTHSTLAPLD